MEHRVKNHDWLSIFLNFAVKTARIFTIINILFILGYILIKGLIIL